ncbi:hypothetical protein CPter291_3393 [Collimonas pratensis]|uniref:Uncharacterized protein n=1 Tax=Collimonas pratensis TaxID=279113 RepID=A0ABM5Z9T1_9BURK|nr:hypothetical protein CPter291_3393 [Collimonas pratensis]
MWRRKRTSLETSTPQKKPVFPVCEQGFACIAHKAINKSVCFLQKIFML